MEKLIVFDGNSILNRAFYGVRPLSNRAGLPTNAVFGFVNILRRAIESVGGSPAYAAIAFDRKEPTFRHKMCDFYKANRKGMPEELAVQMPYAKRVAQALGLAVVECAGLSSNLLPTLHLTHILIGDVVVAIEVETCRLVVKMGTCLACIE